MLDLSDTIIPKSDQLNAEQLIAGEITITITEVVKTNNADQPITIHYSGENGRPYKPNKTFRKILIAIWGADGSQYVGRSLTLYREPTVKWAGKEEGGIQISHASHIEQPKKLSLQVTRGVKKTFTILPLLLSPEQPKKSRNPELAALAQRLKDASSFGVESLQKEAALIPQKYKEEINEWLIKCRANAISVDIASISTEEPLTGFNPIQAPLEVEEPPLPTDSEEPKSVGEIENF